MEVLSTNRGLSLPSIPWAREEVMRGRVARYRISETFTHLNCIYLGFSEEPNTDSVAEIAAF